MEQQPQYRPPQPTTHTTVSQAKSKKQFVWALICLLGPTALIIVSVLLYAIVNFITASVAGTDTQGFNDSPVRTISNVILFLIGAVSTLTWLPGIIVGIVLLATRK